MKKKLFPVLLTLILLVVVPLSACSTPTPSTDPPAQGDTTPVSQPPAPSEPVKIVFWRALTGAAGDVQDELAGMFNESQNEVEVDIQFQGTYGELLQKLQAAMIAGNLPDMVQLDSPFVVLFAKDGALISLDTFAADPANGTDLSDFIPGFLADGYYNGQLYALPYMRSTPLLYYNKEMFAEAGLPDRAPDTWDEFLEFSKALTKVENGQTVQQGVSFTMGATTAHWYLQAAIYAYNGLVSDEDFNMYLTQPEAIAAAKLWQDMVFTEKVGKAGIEEGGSHADFLNHRVGMVFGSTGSMASLRSNADFEVGAGMIPGQVKREVPVGGAVIAMTSKDPARQQATWTFMKYLTQASSVAKIVIDTGYLPTSQSALDHPDLVEYYNQYPERAIALEQLQYARPQASVISFATGTEILRQAVEELLVGNIPVEQVMEKAEKALITEYEEEFK
jgi:sn-glycerol 3-phosphate transport system substrate-binding protein